ncbi:MAG TPA: penicillin-binding protein 1C [Rhodothermales bacterium]|nr:penicillin-binding protein 1C [Rhodothermales bacterium]
MWTNTQPQLWISNIKALLLLWWKAMQQFWLKYPQPIFQHPTVRQGFKRLPLLIFGGMWLYILWPLPSGFAPQAQSRSVRITDRHGQLLYEYRPEGSGLPVQLHEVPPNVVGALLAIEDRRFFRHSGVDMAAMAQALWQNIKTRGISRGGSTITMQVSRMLRDAPRSGLARWWAKGMEVLLAWRLEFHLSKPEILTMWLNKAPFGNRVFGIESAARFYFGKRAHDLSLTEGAFLVGLPQSPTAYNPFSHPERAKRRQEQVLSALVAVRGLTPDQKRSLVVRPLAISKPEQVFKAPHLVNRLIQELPLSTGKWKTLTTTIDLHLQHSLERIIQGHMRRVGQSNVSNAAVVVLDNRTGEVLAYVGSVNFWEERLGGQNDGVQALRQPGSALKPFTYARALASRKYTPSTILPDLPTQILEVGGAFSPENYDKQYHGPVPLRQALASSYNIPAVRMAREIEPTVLLNSFRKAGLFSLRKPAEFYGVGLTLGNGEVTLLELARAYAGIARGGLLPSISFVRDEQARLQYANQPYAHTTPNGLSPQITYLITHILSDPEARTPAFGRGNVLELPFSMAAKTGTSKDYRDNWVVGYTPIHTVAVWVGNFDGSPMQYVSGISGAGPILHDMMLTLGPGGDFSVPHAIEEAVVCPTSGKRPGAFCPTVKKEIFFLGTIPKDTCAVHQSIKINIETGGLADHQTPSALVREELFTVYPPEYHAWMLENGLRLPPRNTEINLPTTSQNWSYTDLLQVQYPASGTVFLLDPVLRREYQRIRLRSVVSDAFYNLRWVIDDVVLHNDYRYTDWPLAPGVHHIALQGQTKEGRFMRSVPARIVVHPPGKDAN